MYKRTNRICILDKIEYSYFLIINRKSISVFDSLWTMELYWRETEDQDSPLIPQYWSPHGEREKGPHSGNTNNSRNHVSARKSRIFFLEFIKNILNIRD